MERLTNHGAEGAAELIISDDLSFDGEWCYDKEYPYEVLGVRIQRALERLSDYEDTGLTPAEVRNRLGRLSTLYKVVRRVSISMSGAVTELESAAGAEEV